MALESIVHQKETDPRPIGQGNLPQTKVLSLGSHLLELFICLFLILITLAAFSQVRNNKFINMDDNLYVTDNPHVREGLTFKGILWAFTSIYAGHWHPMTWLSHMIDYDLYGLNPGGHHMTNLLFHIANTLLLFLLLLRMTGTPWRSGFVAALFAIHPLHVESVAWVSERKDVLSTFFWMLAMGTYLFYVERPKLNRYLSVVLCFILALMSKPMVVTLPFALFLLDYWPLGRLQFENRDNTLSPTISKSINNDRPKVSFLCLVLEKAPLFFLTALSSLFTILTHWGGGAVATLEKLPLQIRIENALISYVRYIAKMIWPNSLAVLYPYPIHLPFWEVAGATFLLLIISVLGILAGRRHPYYIMGWLWYLGTLVPVIGLVQAGVQAMADRFTYIPLIGLFVIVAYGVPAILAGWHHRRVALVTAGSFLLSILMISTVLQVQCWQNSIRLFSHTLSLTVDNWIIHNNLGVTLFREGNEKEAFVHYKKALEINPRYVDARYNLGILLLQQGKDQEAMPYFIEVLRLKPDKGEAHNNLGIILSKQGKGQEAVGHFSEAIRINPNYGEAHFNLGIALIQQGRNGEAIPHLREALRISPKDATIYNSVGVALSGQNQTREAIACYTRALQIDPDYADAHYNLGSLFALQGRHQEAFIHYNEVLRINPRDAVAHRELAVILDLQGKPREAIVHLADAVRITPNYGEAHLTLGMMYLRMGKKELALAEYKTLRKINKHLADTLYQSISKDISGSSTK